MSPHDRLRYRMSVVMNMVIAFVLSILMTQLWLFTVVLDAMENPKASVSVPVAAVACSFVAWVGVWTLIRFFLRAERRGKFGDVDRIRDVGSVK